MLHKKSPAELEPLKTLIVVTNITPMLLKTLRYGVYGWPHPNTPHYFRVGVTCNY